MTDRLSRPYGDTLEDVEIALLSAFLAVSLATAGYLIRRLDHTERTATERHEALLGVVAALGEPMARIGGLLEGRAEASVGA